MNDNSAKIFQKGSLIDQYRIIEKIGEGGMGQVYKAEDTTLKRKVALKFLSQELSRQQQYRNRFLLEARAAAKLIHPNIVNVHGAGQYNGLPYCAMSFIDGRTLAQTLSSQPIPVSRIIDYGLQISEGIAAAHEKGVTHRDLKPSNIIIGDNGTVYVVDFGLALIAELESAGDAEKTATRLTSIDALAGTISYMAPEQLQGEMIGPLVDVFALGIILYELTCGSHPFADTTPVKTAARILRDEPEDIYERRPDAPYDLTRIIGRCLRKDPLRRFQSARDIHNELLDLRESIAARAQNRELPGGGIKAPNLKEEKFILTADLVRKLENKSPRMVGDRIIYLDNFIDSDTLIIYLQPWGIELPQTTEFMASLPCRGIAPLLYGFDRLSPNRFPLTLEDHSILLRALFSEIYERIQPRHILLTGFSAGADHALHLVTSEREQGIPIDSLLSFGCNISFGSCFLSSKFAELEGDNPAGLLDDIKAISNSTRSMGEWIKFNEYMVDVFSRFGENADPLGLLGKGIIEPFKKNDWKQFAFWYRTAMERIPHVRFVVDRDDFDRLDEILARHLESNVLGDNFREDSIAREDISHVELASIELLLRHTKEMIARMQS